MNFNAVEVAKVDVGSWAQRMRIRTLVGLFHVKQFDWGEQRLRYNRSDLFFVEAGAL